jgi:hypothetical protein
VTAQKAGVKPAGCATALRIIALGSIGDRLNVLPFLIVKWNDTPPIFTVVGLTIRYRPSST